MNSEDSTVKKLMLDHRSSQIEKLNISHLNDDCLRLIFLKLSFKDRLTVGLVSKRWNRVCTDSWSNVSELFIFDNFVEKYFNDTTDVRKNTNFIINILKKCGPYLSSLCVYNINKPSSLINFSLLFQEFPINCNNLKSLSLIHNYNGLENDNRVFIDNYFELLFNNNKNLSKIQLTSIPMNGYCLSSLNANSIKDFTLECCKFESIANLCVLLSQLKNVENVYIHSCEIYNNNSSKFVACNAIDALNISGCENISKLDIANCKNNESFLKLVTKQKKLCEIRFICMNDLNRRLFDSITADFLEVISGIHYNDDLLYCLERFHNLRVFDSSMGDLTDQFMREITKLINLKEIHIRVLGQYLLTDIGEDYFSRFQNIEIIRIFLNFERQNIDNILKALGQCKNLKELILSACTFTANGLRNIMQLNLRSLILSFIRNVITNDLMIELIRKSVNLEKLVVRNYKDLTNDFLKMAIEIKSNRNDSHALKIICHELDNLDISLLDNSAQLINFVKNNFVLE